MLLVSVHMFSSFVDCLFAIGTLTRGVIIGPLTNIRGVRNLFLRGGKVSTGVTCG